MLGFRLRWIVACIGLFAASCSQPPPPSVILISLDTVRADRLGVYGYERDTTPNLERLARESTTWEHAYTTASWTLIAHMGMLTGLWPHQHKVVTGDDALGPEIPTLAERLAARGYDTRAFYESGWIHERHGYARGFASFTAHRDAAEAQVNVAQSLAKVEEGRPLFIFIHLFDAHSAELDAEDRLVYQPPPPYDRMFLADAPDRFETGDAARIFDGKQKPTPEQAEALNALYDGGVRYVDDVLGRWFDEWRASGLLDRSIVIVTADHGEALGDREFGFGGHGAMWEEGLRVPMIVRLPDGEQGGRRMRGPASHVDIVPTVLAHLGTAIDPWLVGHPLIDEPPADRVVCAERPPMLTLIQWPRKVATHYSKTSGRTTDLSLDPRELEYLQGGRKVPEFVAWRTRLLDDFRKQLRSRPGVRASTVKARDLRTDELDQIRALGYAGDVEDP